MSRAVSIAALGRVCEHALYNAHVARLGNAPDRALRFDRLAQQAASLAFLYASQEASA